MTVAFSSDGETLASGSLDHTVKLWNASTGKNVATLRGHSGTVWCVAISPDGKTLASGSEDKTVKLWDVAHRKNTVTCVSYAQGVSSLAFRPDGKLLAADDGATINLWEVADGNLRGMINRPGNPPNMAFSPDGKTLAVGAHCFERIWFWDVDTCKNTAEVEGQFVEGVAYAPDGETLVWAGGGGEIRLLDAATHKDVAVINLRLDKNLYVVAFSPDGETLAATTDLQTITLFDIGALRQGGKDR